MSEIRNIGIVSLVFSALTFLLVFIEEVVFGKVLKGFGLIPRLVVQKMRPRYYPPYETTNLNLLVSNEKRWKIFYSSATNCSGQLYLYRDGRILQEEPYQLLWATNANPSSINLNIGQKQRLQLFRVTKDGRTYVPTTAGMPAGLTEIPAGRYNMVVILGCLERKEKRIGLGTMQLPKDVLESCDQ